MTRNRIKRHVRVRAGDLVPRLIWEHLPALLGQRLVLEHKSGANTMIGAEAAALVRPLTVSVEVPVGRLSDDLGEIVMIACAGLAGLTATVAFGKATPLTVIVVGSMSVAGLNVPPDGVVAVVTTIVIALGVVVVLGVVGAIAGDLHVDGRNHFQLGQERLHSHIVAIGVHSYGHDPFPDPFKNEQLAIVVIGELIGGIGV